mgnify:CR=1 FL=1
MELSHADRPVEAVIRLVRVDGRDRSVWSCAAAAHIKEVSPLGGVDARLHAAALARTSRCSDASSPARDARTAAHCAPRPRRRCHPLQRLTRHHSACYTPAVAQIARGELRLLGEVGDHDGGGRNGGVAGCSSVVRRREGSAERHARYERGRCADCAWRSLSVAPCSKCMVYV